MNLGVTLTSCVRFTLFNKAECIVLGLAIFGTWSQIYIGDIRGHILAIYHKRNGWKVCL